MFFNFIHECQDLLLKINYERQIFVKHFKAILITLRRGGRRRYIFISFCWRFLPWDLNRGLMSNKLTHYLLNNGDFEQHLITKSLNYRDKLNKNWNCMMKYIIRVLQRDIIGTE